MRNLCAMWRVVIRDFRFLVDFTSYFFVLFSLAHILPWGLQTCQFAKSGSESI